MVLEVDPIHQLHSVFHFCLSFYTSEMLVIFQLSMEMKVSAASLSDSINPSLLPFVMK